MSFQPALPPQLDSARSFHRCFLQYTQKNFDVFLTPMENTTIINEMKTRRITPFLKNDLDRKMVFLAGPRQCGKTTISKSLVREREGRYYTWDLAADRKLILNGLLEETCNLWVFDELHKNRKWRNWLKGIYDTHGNDHEICVTGSARLEVFGRGGDSLQGRYFLHHLHPFTLSELMGTKMTTTKSWLPPVEFESHKNAQGVLNDLVQLGGFPEPFLSGSERDAKRWRLSYGTRLVEDEIRSLEQVTDLNRMELLFDRLSQTVGSVLSINSLREDLEVAHGTLTNWVNIFERLYGVFRIHPFGAPRLKAVKKEAKLYFWDWSRIENDSARFENLVAVHLYRLMHWIEDTEGEKCELRYFRDTLGKEVDFIFMKNGKPLFVVEVKSDERPLDPNLKYFVERVQIPRAFQVSLKGERNVETKPINGCRINILPARQLLMEMP